MNPDKEPILYEIHSLNQISCFSSEKDDEIENDICSDCYCKLKHIISEKKWEDNVIPNEVLKKCLSNKE